MFIYRQIIGWSRCLTCGGIFEVYTGDEIEDDCPSCRAKAYLTEEKPED